MILSIILFVASFVILLIEPLSAMHLIAAGVLVVSGAFNVLLRTYITYVLKNPVTGLVYIGRTSGFGEPNKILKRRLSAHEYVKKGFKNPMIDKAIQRINAYRVIRGREQQLIDFYGGIGSSKVANIKRGVSKRNKRRHTYHALSNKYFGNLSPFSGNK